MARTEQNNVDYFPFLCKEGKGMYYIETKYGNDGYATWLKILRQLAVTNYHYLDLNSDVEFMFLASKCKISESKLIEIIEDLGKLGELDYQLWKEKKVVFSEKFIENIKDAYNRRNNKCITKADLCIQLSNKCIHNDTTAGLLYQNNDINPHSKVNKSKVNKSKVNKREFDLFFLENSDLKFCFEKFIEYRKKIKPFKTQQGLEQAFRSLIDLSKNNLEIAESIVNQSISNEWQGLFELKEKSYEKKENNHDRIQPIIVTRSFDFSKRNGNSS